MLKVLKIKNNIKKNTQVIDENYINQFAPSFDCDLYESKYEVYDLYRLILKSVALGDSAGAPLEGRKNVEVPQNFLYLNNSNITDDTTLTVATMHAIMQLKEFPDFTKYYALYGKNYPDMGYGGSFYSWIKLKKKKPYNSYGNGSAMRVAPVVTFAKDVNRCIELAYLSSIVTHNHPEGIKGAIVTAVCVYLASKKDITKGDIIKYASSHYPELNKMNKENMHSYLSSHKLYPPVSCQKSLPIALYSFANTDNFEDCIRMAISFCHDTDTDAAIAGSIAGVFYNTFSEESEKQWNRIQQHKIFNRFIYACL